MNTLKIKKYRVKSVINVDINMATTNVTQKEIQCHFEKTQIRLKSYSGHQIPTRGVVTLPCEHKGNVYNVQFHVVEV